MGCQCIAGHQYWSWIYSEISQRLQDLATAETIDLPKLPRSCASRDEYSQKLSFINKRRCGRRFQKERKKKTPNPVDWYHIEQVHENAGTNKNAHNQTSKQIQRPLLLCITEVLKGRFSLFLSFIQYYFLPLSEIFLRFVHLSSHAWVTAPAWIPAECLSSSVWLSSPLTRHLSPVVFLSFSFFLFLSLSLFCSSNPWYE